MPSKLTKERPPLAIELTEADKRDLVASVDAMCWKMAHRAKRRWWQAGEVDDFYQAARLGALMAANRWDAARELTFLTYATWYIRRAIQEFEERGGNIIRRPTHQHRGVTVEPPPVNQMPIGRDGDEMPIAGRPDNPEAAIYTSEVSGLAAEALDYLPEKLRFVIQRRFGLDGFPPDTLQDIACLMGFSKERVRQLEMEGLARLRRVLEGEPRFRELIPA